MKISAFNNKFIALMFGKKSTALLLNVVVFLITLKFAPYMISNPSAVSSQFYLLTLMVTVLAHEAIHALFLKLFSPTAHVYFGIKSCCPYAMSRGGHYTKAQFIWALLAPFVLITTAYLFLGAMAVLPKDFSNVMLVFHALACIGDFAMAWESQKVPAGRLITDEPGEVGFMVAEGEVV